MLRKYGMDDGLFLIRSSIKCHGYYVLSMAVGGKAYHFQIKSRVGNNQSLFHEQLSTAS